MNLNQTIDYKNDSIKTIKIFYEIRNRNDIPSIFISYFSKPSYTQRKDKKAFWCYKIDCAYFKKYVNIGKNFKLKIYE